MKKSVVYLDFSLRVNCPHCEHKFDLVCQDGDYDENVVNPVFRNEWSKPEGEEVICPQCEKTFLIERIIY